MGKKVTAGNQLSISARDWNGMLDVLEDFRRRKQLGMGRGGPPAQGPQPVIIKVRNDTGDDRRRGDVVEIGSTILSSLDTEVTNDYLWFEGLEPDLSNLTFGILYDHLPEDEIGRVVLTGVCYAYVTINDEDHKYAELASGSCVLSSAPTGPVKILNKAETGTGEKKCRVQIGGWTKRVWVCKPDADIAKDATGTISLWEWNGSAMADTTFNVTALADGAAVKSGKKCTAWQDERNKWLVAPKEC